MTVEIDGDSLTIQEFIRVARHYEEVTLSKTARSRVIESRKVVESIVESGQTVYGVNTGFGDLSDVKIKNDDLCKLQANLIRSHSVGVGPPFSEEVVRGMMLLRANALVKGYSGVRLVVVETLLDFLNKKLTPIVPEQGSVGSSGDLAPLAHMVLAMMGESDVLQGGDRIESSTAMMMLGIEPLKLQAKEGVALINGTQPMTSVGALAVHDTMNVLTHATIAAAMSLEALRGTRAAYDSRIHDIRPHEGQKDVATAMRSILTDSEINQSHADCGKVQDAYSLRCIPQVLGASLDALRYVTSTIETEINAVTDNPLVFPQESDIISGGNFHGQPIALAMDFLGIALSEVANISERRINRLVNPVLSELPPFLTKKSGLDSGMMIAQYTAAALVSENKVLAHPASVDSIPTSADQEDHVSMGTIAARKARTILDNVMNVIAIEYLCAAQGIDLLSPLHPSEPLKVAHSVIRDHVSVLEDDRPLSGDIALIRNLISEGVIVKKVEEVTGPIFEP
jgi:histidine ammonia-lyase